MAAWAPTNQAGLFTDASLAPEGTHRSGDRFRLTVMEMCLLDIWRDATLGRMAMRLIIVIDGDQDFLREISRDLGGLRYRVVAVASAKKGLELARMGNPDLIMLDMEIPGSSGKAVMAELKADEITANIPVLITLQTAGKEKLIAARQAGAVDFLLKPYKREVLLEKLEQLWQSKEEREARERAKIRTTPVSASSLKITRSGNRMALVLPPMLNDEYDLLLRQEHAAGAFQVGEGGELILDLRPLGELNPPQRKLLIGIVDLFSAQMPIVVAGRHYGMLLQDGYDETCRLFLSLDELLAYLKYVGKA